MSHEYYINECRRLREVLSDARDRGDYHLEMDVLELLEQLQAQYNKED